MQSGAVYGYLGLANGLLGRIRREPARATPWIRRRQGVLTGGLSAAPWAQLVEGANEIDPELTLKGLAILHAEVTGGEPLELGLS